MIASTCRLVKTIKNFMGAIIEALKVPKKVVCLILFERIREYFLEEIKSEIDF